MGFAAGVVLGLLVCLLERALGRISAMCRADGVRPSDKLSANSVENEATERIRNSVMPAADR